MVSEPMIGRLHRELAQRYAHLAEEAEDASCPTEGAGTFPNR